jgi:maleate isomerase
MSSRILLGMLTPSSNTTLEPVTAAMIAGLPEVSAHFGRFRVTEIALSNQALGQFDDHEILRAAELLSHAKVGVIGWNGTSSGWLGFDADERLCRRITGVKRFGLVTPYLDDVQAAIVKNYAASGFECVAERHLRKCDNFSFSEVSADEIRTMVREAAKARPDAITIFCTNLRGAPLVEEMEAETGIPIYDTIATVVWKSLKLVGADPARVKGWGQLFRSGL